MNQQKQERLHQSAEVLPFQELNPDGAETLVLVGGITEGVRTLDPLAHALAEKDFRVISYDQTAGPAAIKSKKFNRYHTAKSTQLTGIIESAPRNENDRLTLLAHSQGAVFAINSALKRPENIERVVLFNPAGLFEDSFPRLAGRFAVETVRKTVTMKSTAQRQQVEGVKRMARYPRDFIGDATDIAASTAEDKIKELQDRGIKVDIVLSNKDQVFPWRHMQGYFEDQNPDRFDFNSVSMFASAKPSGKSMHKLASKWAGHDNAVIYPENTAELVSQLVRGE